MFNWINCHLSIEAETFHLFPWFCFHKLKLEIECWVEIGQLKLIMTFFGRWIIHEGFVYLEELIIIMSC